MATMKISLGIKRDLWCKDENFSKERPNIIAKSFPILEALCYKLACDSAIKVDFKNALVPAKN